MKIVNSGGWEWFSTSKQSRSGRLIYVVWALMVSIWFFERGRIVIRFLWVSSKFGTCTVVSVNGTLVKAKVCVFTLESTPFIFNKCPIFTHDGASAKFSTNSHETDYSAGIRRPAHNVRCPLKRALSVDLLICYQRSAMRYGPSMGNILRSARC